MSKRLNINIRELRTELTQNELCELTEKIQNQGLLYTNSGSGIIREMEQNFSDFFMRRHAISVPNGTSALSNAFDALELKENQSFIVPAYAYPSGVHYLKRKGIKLIPIDIERDSLNIDPERIEQSIKSETRGILLVNMWGFPAYYKEISEIAKNKGLLIVEDASRSVGALREGLESILNFGDISCISLSAYKLIAAGEGGIILTDNVKYHDLAVLTGQTLNPNLILPESRKRFTENFSSKNKIHPVGALIALFSLKHLNERLAQCNENFRYANLKLGQFDFFEVLNCSEDIKRGGWSGWSAFYNPFKNKGISIDDFIEKLRGNGFPIAREYPTNFHIDLNNKGFQNTKYVKERLVTIEGICSYQKSAFEQIDKCAEMIRRIY